MPVVVSRWHLELSKNFLPARYAKLAAVHGAPVRSSSASITPWFVVIVISDVPVFGIFVVGGFPTSLIVSEVACGVHAQSSATEVFLRSKPPEIHTMPTTTR